MATSSGSGGDGKSRKPGSTHNRGTPDLQNYQERGNANRGNPGMAQDKGQRVEPAQVPRSALPDKPPKRG